MRQYWEEEEEVKHRSHVESGHRLQNLSAEGKYWGTETSV